jgi:hypothetical protein
VGFPDDMRVEAGPNVPEPVATAKTVAEFSLASHMATGFVLVVQHSRDSGFASSRLSGTDVLSGAPPPWQLFRSQWRCGIEATRGFRLAIKIA